MVLLILPDFYSKGKDTRGSLCIFQDWDSLFYNYFLQCHNLMKIILESNQTYVVAVSGGVDSVVLLDMLVQSADSDSDLIVAHFDHGMRPNSSREALFVEKLAQEYGLDFMTERAELGPQASEATARTARYKFLREVMRRKKARAVMTAHHLDDFFETVVMNFHRGCHRRGLVSLKSEACLLRPLLRLERQKIVDYAQKRRLAWIEDPSNDNLKYLRNYIRHKIMPKLTAQHRKALLAICDELALSNRELDQFLENYLKYRSYRRAGRVFARNWFNQLTHAQAAEVVAAWLAKGNVGDYKRSQIDYIVVKLKTLKPGKIIMISPSQTVKLTKRSLRLEL